VRFGVGLAAAALIDATIIRAILLPASMKLLGRLELVPAEVARVAAPFEHCCSFEEPKAPSAAQALEPTA
jgi:uncharacterized membrane protein YdfJ with MMPL/SSD domain